MTLQTHDTLMTRTFFWRQLTCHIVRWILASLNTHIFVRHIAKNTMENSLKVITRLKLFHQKAVFVYWNSIGYRTTVHSVPVNCSNRILQFRQRRLVSFLKRTFVALGLGK
jgi:hypothetical protein